MQHPTPAEEGIDLDAAGPAFREWYAERERHARPALGQERAPITTGQYHYRVPDKFELFGGYLFGPGDDAWWQARREDLLALLLANVGLRRAVRLAPHEAWRAALTPQPPLPEGEGEHL